MIRKIKSGRSKEFDGYGVYMFVGLPGSGKTILPSHSVTLAVKTGGFRKRSAGLSNIID